MKIISCQTHIQCAVGCSITSGCILVDVKEGHLYSLRGGHGQKHTIKTYLSLIDSKNRDGTQVKEDVNSSFLITIRSRNREQVFQAWFPSKKLRDTGVKVREVNALCFVRKYNTVIWSNRYGTFNMVGGKRKKCFNGKKFDFLTVGENKLYLGQYRPYNFFIYFASLSKLEKVKKMVYHSRMLSQHSC